MLIQQLKDLEVDHVIARIDYKEVPPRVDDALTPLGRSLADAIVPLCTWGTENRAEVASVFAKRDTSPWQPHRNRRFCFRRSHRFDNRSLQAKHVLTGR